MIVDYKNLELLERIRIVPVIVLSDVEKAVPLAKSLCAGGIPIAEVTFRTAQAEEILRKMSTEVPEILVGAGTVHSVETAELAVINGARFIVTAGYNEPVVDWCVEQGIDVFPGCVTPSDLERLLLRGLHVAKFFPAEAYGGIKVLKAFAGPYSNVRFMPTGGISEQNVRDYLALPAVIACGGAWMVQEKLVSEGRFDEITELCKKALKCR